MSHSSCASFARAVVWLAAGMIVVPRSHALDPGTVFLEATQAQRLVDGRARITLQWNALGGATYRVQGQNDLSQSGWLDFGLVTPSGTSGQWTGTVASALVDQGRFFMRLVLPQEVIQTVEPAFIPTSGGVFYLLGQCFSPTDRVFVNGVEATVVVFEDHTRLKVTLGAVAAGVYDVEVRDSGGVTVLAKLRGGVTTNANGRDDHPPPKLPLANIKEGDPVNVKTVEGEVVATYLPQDIRQGETVSGTVAVRPATGEVVHAGVDLVVPGRGLGFVWARTYRSKAGPSTAQGEGWDFSYNISATQSGGDVVVRDGEGRADTFFDQGDGTWSRAEFFRQGTMSGTVFTLMFADKTAWRFRAFDAATAPGKIDRITDRNGNHIDFAYDGAGKLVTVADTLGKNYTVAYDGAGRIASVTDFTGRAVTYGYNAAGDLTNVTSPPVTGTPTANDFPSGKTTTFTYSSGFVDARLNHNLLTVTDALGQLVLQNTYAATLLPADLDFDRCTQQVRGGALAETVTFSYLPQTPNPANRFCITLTIINDIGDVSEVRSDSRNRPLELREYTGRSTPGAFVTDVANRPTGQVRVSDPAFFATSFDWTPHSQLRSVTFPRGGQIVNTYESDLNAAANPRERGNLRVQQRVAAPSVASDFAVLTESWTHVPGFGAGEGGYSCPPLDAAPLPSTPISREDLEECATNTGRCSESRILATNASRADSPPDAMGSDTRGPRRFGAGSQKPQACDLDRAEEGAGLSARSYGGGGGSSGCMAFIASHTDARGYTTNHGRDGNGNPTTLTPPVAGTAHTFEYNGFGQLTAHVWPQNASGGTRRDEYSYYTSGPQLGWLQNEVIDSAGLALTTTWEYNNAGVLVRVVDPRGKDTLITVNALNQPVRLASREISAGVRHETDIRYDADDRVTSIDVQNKDETGALVAANPYFTTLIQYDLLGRTTQITREVDAVTTITTERVIDASNHTVTRRSPEAVAGTQPQNVETCIFDERGLPFQIVLAPGSANQSTTQRDYDADGNLAAVHQGLESTPRDTLIAWDGLPPGRRIFAQAEPFRIHGQFDGNASNTQASVRGGAPPLTFTCSSVSDAVTYQIVRAAKTGYDWHEDFIIGCTDRCVDPDEDNYGVTPARARSVEDAMGNLVVFIRDENGNLITTRFEGEHTDVPGNASNVRLAESRTTFDANNRPFIFTGLLLDPSGNQTGFVSKTVTWAPDSQLATTTDERGNVTTFGYDTAGRLSLVTDPKTNTRACGYDPNGNVTTITATDRSDLGAPQQVFVVTRTFDGIDRLATSADNVGNTTQWRYNSLSNLVLVIDPRGIQTRNVFDALGRQLSTAIDMDNDGASATDPQDIVTSRTWNRNSRLATSTNASGYVTTYADDALNRLVVVHYPDGTSSQVSYDVHHNLTQSIDANGTFVSLQYDLDDRLVSENVSPGSGVAATITQEQFGYNGLGWIKSALTNGTAGTTSVSRDYDSLGRMTSETQGAFTVSFGYDAAGNLTSCAYPGGNTVTRTFDVLNRMVTMTDSASGLIVTNKYIGPDRVERRTFGNGVQTNFLYSGIQGVPNASGDFGWRLLRSQITTGPGGTLDSRQFFHDASQNTTRRINLVTNTTTNYTLDNANRLANTLVQQGVTTVRNTTYTLDKAGNRQNVTGDLHPGAYTMNATLPVPADAQVNQYTSAPTGVFTYDEEGNRKNATSAGTTIQNVYDFNNNLVAVNNLTSGQPVATYQLDAFGRRIQKVVNPSSPTPQVRNFTFAGSGVIEERDGVGALTARMLQDGGGVDPSSAGGDSAFAPPLVEVRGGTPRTLHADDVGSTVLVTAASGGATERYEYQDFGEPQFFTGAYSPLTGTAIGNVHLFGGAHFDSETALYFHPACISILGWYMPPIWPFGPKKKDDPWIELGTWLRGLSPSGQAGGNAGAGDGRRRGDKPSITDIVVTKTSDKASTKLAEVVADGKAPEKPGKNAQHRKTSDPKTDSDVNKPNLRDLILPPPAPRSQGTDDVPPGWYRLDFGDPVPGRTKQK